MKSEGMFGGTWRREVIEAEFVFPAQFIDVVQECRV